MPRYRVSVTALIIASTLLFSEGAAACTFEPPALRPGIGCGIAMGAGLDRELGIFPAEWEQAFRLIGEHDNRYMQAPAEQLPEIQVAFHDRLGALIDAGNPIAKLVLALDVLQNMKQMSETERRARLQRGVPLATEAAEAGSVVAMVFLIAIFSPSFGDEALPSEARLCWEAAARSLESLPKELTSITKDDQRLWAGRACIAPTLEALRN